jgi:hypothetical protein
MATTQRRTLLDISDDLIALGDLLDERDGDISGIEQAIDQWMAEIGTDRDAKLDNYAALIRERELVASALKAEEERLAMRRRVAENTIKSLKDRLKMFFERTGLRKVETKRYVIAVQANGGLQPLELSADAVADPKSLPLRFHLVTIEADTEAIRKAIDKGESLPFASLGERGTHLRIR